MFLCVCVRVHCALKCCEKVTFSLHLLDVIFLHQSVGVGSLCDNIEIDQRTGDMWLGCHPNGLKLLKNDPEDPPGSEVSVLFFLFFFIILMDSIILYIHVMWNFLSV